MKKLSIDLENCFGIGRLKHEFDFDTHKSNSFLIYAPNGTMKTSFAKTFDLISRNDSKNVPCDKVYDTRKAKYIVEGDGSTITPDNILVINAEDNSFDASNKITTFLAGKDLKNKYEKIYTELDSQKLEYIKRLKGISKSTDCETEFINSFSDNPKASFFETITTQEKELKNKPDQYSFKYNDVFDKKNNVQKFLIKNDKILTEYITDYKNLISQSSFFKESEENPFGTYQANELLKSIEDNSFFEAGHKFILEDGTEVENSEKLKEIVQEEIQKIINNDKLKESFERVDKAIGANVELRAFKRVLERDNLLLIELKDYENFRKKIWVNYISEQKKETEELINFYKSKKKELEKIITEAKKDIDLWKDILSTFNSRFYVPFDVILTNQEDLILKQETAILEFDYLEKNQTPKRQKKENLLNVLSKGEQRAFYILQFLFEIESRKNSIDKHLLILDDIADSFDYKNKYAIIEYIKDLHLSDNFRIIILTHNFDFYRTIASRLYLPREVTYMCAKSEDKIIKLEGGEYQNDAFIYFLKNYSNPNVFISLIAFVRNIIEYTDSKKCDDYLTLTDCLHKKSNSDKLTVQDIFNIFTKRITKLNDKTVAFGAENMIQFIFNNANLIYSNATINEIHLENKITLAIATRLKAEEYLINKLPEVDLSLIKSNQAYVLYQEYKIKFSTSLNIKILDKVNLMTPENIHINAFMYEPLIDMSVHHLKELYKNVCDMK